MSDAVRSRLAQPVDFNPRRLAGIVTCFLPLYLVWTHLALGLRGEHLLIAGGFIAAFWAGPRSAWFAFQALPILGVGIAYDNLRLLMDLRREIHVADLYAAELAWFGVGSGAERMILPEYFRRHPQVVFDFLCGFAYLTYLLETFLVAVVLFFKDPPQLSRLAWGFLVINLAGMVTWVLWPAAPPWYVELHGLGPALPDAAPWAAGAARFDALIGVGVFEGFYSRNANVFGAMPSLHCGYPTLVLLAVWKYGRRWRIPAALFLLLVAFSAVYLRHHYVWDVVVGVLYGVVTHLALGLLFGWRASRVAARRPGSTFNADAEELP